MIFLVFSVSYDNNVASLRSIRPARINNTTNFTYDFSAKIRESTNENFCTHIYFVHFTFPTIRGLAPDKNEPKLDVSIMFLSCEN